MDVQAWDVFLRRVLAAILSEEVNLVPEAGQALRGLEAP
jgi:hypothetical protein